MKERVLLLSLFAILTPSVDSTVCTGDLVWKTDASICIPTCTAHFYPDKELCPTRTLGRCVCPDEKIKLEDTSDKCVGALSQECRAATKKYMDDPSSQFKFSKEPEDVTVVAGDSVTLSCLVSNQYTIQYIWYKLEELPQGDSTAEKNLYMTGTSQLVFKDISPQEAGFYQCKAVAAANFLMISGVGRVRVKHFTTQDTEVSDERVTENAPLASIACAAINVDPIPTIRWYFDEEPIDFENPSYFMNRNKGSSDYGTLYLQNIEEDHAGTYRCEGFSRELDKTAQLAVRTLLITGSQNFVTGAPKVLESANYGDKTKLGSEGELYCGGYGHPAPEVKWFKVAPIGQDQPEIKGCTEANCVSQGGRRLTIYNLEASDFGDYQCVVKNSFDHITKILAMSREPDSYAVRFDSISRPIKIMPNRYTRFTLTCVVDTSQNPETYMGWYQNTQGISDKGDRIRIFSSTRENQIVHELVFDYPTNDDHGVFQCLVYNSRTFKQLSTDVYVYMSRAADPGYDSDSDFAVEMYDPNSVKEYKYFSELKTAMAAEAVCREWRQGGHLAAILSYTENDDVFNLIMANKDATNETRAWIGLTDEGQEGIWKWLSQEVSDRFAFWWRNHPDNSAEDRDYSYMDAAKSGHWLDGGRDLELPFICKHYNASCIDLELQTELDIQFLEYVNKGYSSQISVYDTARVRCGKAEAVLECAPSGQWVPTQDKACPQIDEVKGRGEENKSAASTTYTTYQTLILSFIVIAYHST